MDRWWRIALESARQCARTELPSLTGPWTLEGLCERAASCEALKFVLWEDEERVGLRQGLEDTEGRLEEIWLCVGPEGGFHVEEVRRLERVGFRSVRMGPRILRTETAGATAVAILQYLHGDLG
jgi:16S rRNA (uracil1498-N3)-methyltransferase